MATTIPIFLEDEELAKITAATFADVGHDPKEIGVAIDPSVKSYYDCALEWFTAVDGTADFAEIYLIAQKKIADFDTYFRALAEIHKRPDAARSRRKDLQVLFITGYAENAAIGNGHLDHGMEILTKPFAMTTLANKVRWMLER
jgi:hypothetical protein